MIGRTRTGAHHRALRKIGFVACQLVLIASLFELALRIVGPRVWPLKVVLYSPSARTNFDAVDDLETLFRKTILGFRPGFEARGFTLNSRSLRTREYGPKPDGIYRVVIGGDSFAFGSGGTPFDAMWTTRLEPALNTDAPRPVEVLSLGVPGVGAAFQLRLWELEQESLDADLVVLSVFVGNDFEEVLPPPTDGPRRLRDVSYAARALRNATLLWRHREAAPAHSRDRKRPTGVVSDPDYVRDPVLERFNAEQEIRQGLRRLSICAPDRTADLGQRATILADIVARFRDEVALAGGKFAVVIIPDAYQVDDALQRLLLEQPDFAESEIDVDCAQRRLGPLLEARGVSYLDLLSVFREAGRTERLYWYRDTHWNLAGNALASNELARYLRSEGLLFD